MALTLRRLGVGDEAILGYLAAHNHHFALAEHNEEPGKALAHREAERFLANPAVLYWVAFDGHTPVGMLYCIWLPLDADARGEVLLYDIGVHKEWRRHGAGRALLAAMNAWMAEQAIDDVWVLADNPAAVAFYRACGFDTEAEQPVYMTRA